MKDLSKRIKSVMAKYHVTQVDLAARLGNHPVVVNSTINNPNIKVSTLARYAEAIGCDVAEFFV